VTEQIALQPIGVIRTPYRTHADIPIQGRFKPETEGCAVMAPEYVPGLQDLDGFSHAFLLYYFHDTDRVELTAEPFLEPHRHGVFACRSPHRPNHIGLSVVAIHRIEGGSVYFGFVDVVDGTPLLDIKPYVPHFDCFSDARSGWVDKHFVDGQIPEATTTKRTNLGLDGRQT